jgi:hypothetical protein
MTTVQQLLKEKETLAKEIAERNNKILTINDAIKKSTAIEDVFLNTNILPEEKEFIKKISETWTQVKIEVTNEYTLVYKKEENGFKAVIIFHINISTGSIAYHIQVTDSNDNHVFYADFDFLEEIEKAVKSCFVMLKVEYNIPTVAYHNELELEQAIEEGELNINFIIDEAENFSEKIVSKTEVILKPGGYF